MSGKAKAMRRRTTLAAMAFAAFAIAVATPAHAERQPLSAPQCDAAAFRVIVDVGHTPEEPGAISARGSTEYDFNHRLAKVVEARLNEAGFGRTSLLMAKGDAIPSLVRRIAQANAAGADLLISIHHDSVPEAFKSFWQFNGQPMQYSDRFKGHSIFVSRDNPHYRNSVAFGSLLGARLKARGLDYTPHYKEAFMGARRRALVDAETGVYRYDQLLILRTTRMPAILLEAGSIVHRDEELLMANADHQRQIASAIAEAVDSFCAARGPKTRSAGAGR
jgi:N-acetylmuramoyl-L-alanine amidase